MHTTVIVIFCFNSCAVSGAIYITFSVKKQNANRCYLDHVDYFGLPAGILVYFLLRYDSYMYLLLKQFKNGTNKCCFYSLK